MRVMCLKHEKPFQWSSASFLTPHQSNFGKYVHICSVYVYFLTIILWLLIKKNRKPGLPANRKTGI